jgi:hypothetical protein
LSTSFSLDGALVVTSSVDDKAKLWNVESGDRHRSPLGRGRGGWGCGVQVRVRGGI